MSGAQGPGGELLETQQVLVANWGVVPVRQAEEDLNWNLLLEALAERIVWLLRHDSAKLVNAMYVLDISEGRYANAMGEPTTEAKSLALARAILERESEKIAMRRKYANRQGEYLAGIYDDREAPPEQGLRQSPRNEVNGD
jgi:hypothetical protein